MIHEAEPRVCVPRRSLGTSKKKFPSLSGYIFKKNFIFCGDGRKLLGKAFFENKGQSHCWLRQSDKIMNPHRK
ncbi:Uncharacterized protein dnm_056730 [Desulfonema magnum]|uniref:Uncharacterized protein n=1 Tax=Desulfonema magnum TaxID=45655 RepID=A0A975BQ34_9BACT|nr:Uncharacterized protein dnm_056730 [Desulfonema magnum]